SPLVPCIAGGYMPSWPSPPDEDSIDLGTVLQVIESLSRPEDMQLKLALVNGVIAFLEDDGSAPELWAALQNVRGITLLDDPQGNQGENLDEAIVAFKKSLTVRTRELFPVDWAKMQHNLGLAYAARIRGDHEDNVEQAISVFQAALTVRTRETFPGEWAAT